MTHTDEHQQRTLNYHLYPLPAAASWRDRSSNIAASKASLSITSSGLIEGPKFKHRSLESIARFGLLIDETSID